MASKLMEESSRLAKKLSTLIFKLAKSSHKTRLERFLFFGAADQFGPFFHLCVHGQNKVLLLLVSAHFGPFSAAADQGGDKNHAGIHVTKDSTVKSLCNVQGKQQNYLSRTMTPTRELNKLKQPDAHAVRRAEKRTRGGNVRTAARGKKRRRQSSTSSVHGWGNGDHLLVTQPA
jgi:hypothetical protein